MTLIHCLNSVIFFFSVHVHRIQFSSNKLKGCMIQVVYVCKQFLPSSLDSHKYILASMCMSFMCISSVNYYCCCNVMRRDLEWNENEQNTHLFKNISCSCCCRVIFFASFFHRFHFSFAPVKYSGSFFICVHLFGFYISVCIEFFSLVIMAK